MDSEETKYYEDIDSENESSGDDAIANEIDSFDSRESKDDVDEYRFEVLSTEKIVQHMNSAVLEVSDIVAIPPTITRILLNHFSWDKEKLMEKLYDGEQEQVFRDAHVLNPSRKLSKESSSTESSQSNEECGICLTPASDMAGLECGHRFCRQCWDDYITTKIMEEGVGQTISCAAHGCDIIVDDATVMTLVSSPRVQVRYQHLITNSFVECNRLLRWCSTPDCENAIRVHHVDCRPVTCTCNRTFCFACGKDWHEPVMCSLLKKWTKKCDEDSETSNWIAANTKECPKCGATIEKDGGCNHMVCKNPACKAEFCWTCLGPWEPHGSAWYNCNRYDAEEAQIARNAQERSRAELHRYLFYFNRYMNHMQSLKFEHNLYESMKQKMEDIQECNNISWVEVQFLKKAVGILCQCRQALMYTYVFAYYLKKNNQSIIFEDNQKDLEGATETLSEYLERKVTSANLDDMKQKVLDKSRYCEGRRKVLIDHVYEGYDKNLWDYTEESDV